MGGSLAVRCGPTASMAQVLGYGELRLLRNMARSVDALLAGRQPPTQLRRLVGRRALVRFEGAAPGDAGSDISPAAIGGLAGGGQGRGAAEGQWLEDLVHMSRLYGTDVAE